MSILLADPNKCEAGGHNYIYRNELSKIEGTTIIEKSQVLSPITKSPITGYRQRSNYLNSLPSDDILHILYFDAFYPTPFLLKQIHNKYRKIVGTLHWLPNSAIKKNLIKSAAQYVDVIIVHSDYIQNQLEQIGIRNVLTINYPSFGGEDHIPKSLIIKKSSTYIFTCLGGSRYDKGFDILADSFRSLSSNAKMHSEFVFAGKESDIKYADIINIAKKEGVAITIDDRFLSDKEYWGYIINSDAIILPYRSKFTGNSGPMTDGIYACKTIIGPSSGNLGYLIKKHKLGFTFVCEDSKSLATAIENCINKNSHIKSDYQKELSVYQFSEKHRNLYNALLKC